MTLMLLYYYYYCYYYCVLPVTVAVRSEAWVLTVGCWDRGFESRSRHGCLSASFCVVLSCVGEGLATG
jgi:hypothetical protein